MNKITAFRIRKLKCLQIKYIYTRVIKITGQLIVFSTIFKIYNVMNKLSDIQMRYTNAT